MKQFETERLILRELRLSDSKAVFELLSSDETAKYMAHDPYPSLLHVEKFISSLKSTSNLFGIFLKEKGEFIGTCSATYHYDDKCYNIGYMLIDRYRNRGYATESAKGIMSWAKNRLGAKKFIASCAVENIPSKRVIEKCGFSFVSCGTVESRNGKKRFKSLNYELKLK